MFDILVSDCILRFDVISKLPLLSLLWSQDIGILTNLKSLGHHYKIS